MKGVWVRESVRDAVVDFIDKWSKPTGIRKHQFLSWLDLSPGKYHDWRHRHRQPNCHNGQIPKTHWLLAEEKQAIIAYARQHPDAGYRRLAYMMLDADVAAASPSSVRRVLLGAGLLNRWNRTPSQKGMGFNQPYKPHQHWHMDIAYLNISGTFYYLCSILDGYSRFIVHWEIRERMREPEVEIILQRGLEAWSGVHPRIITDNGPQFIAKDFKAFIRLSGMTQVRTSPYYPQSNGKIERWHRSLKSEAIRPGVPLSLKDAQRIVGSYVVQYNEQRLHSALGYITPKDQLEGKAEQIQAERREKLATAEAYRRQAQTSRRCA